MAHEEQNDPVAQSSASGIPKSPLYPTTSSSESSDTNSGFGGVGSLLRALLVKKITERSRVREPSLEMIILSTSQAGLRRAAPSSYTALWQKAGDQPSYREPSPFGGCNFLSHKCFCNMLLECFFDTKTLMRESKSSQVTVSYTHLTLPTNACV